MTSVAAPTVVHTRAPGKINVFLAVGDLQDDGYHELATAYQAVSLYEDVRARHADGFSVSVHAAAVDRRVGRADRRVQPRDQGRPPPRRRPPATAAASP